MGLMLKQQRDGTLRPHWYGVYTEGEKRKVVNLDVSYLSKETAIEIGILIKAINPKVKLDKEFQK